MMLGVVRNVGWVLNRGCCILENSNRYEFDGGI